ncbi:MAG: CoA transferase [Chloroflexi bacterium]|nr:CoA transferase [Chloroflexota bacterium]
MADGAPHQASPMGDTTEDSIPLRGFRVVDFSKRYPGPFATLWLAAYGAEVIQVESQMQPEPQRRLVRDADGSLVQSKRDVRVGFFIAQNYSKLNCSVNLQQTGSRDLVRRLVQVADVVVDSFSTGVLSRFGLDYATLRRMRPDIIALSVSGFGRTGPARDYRAFGQVASSFGGVDSLTGHKGGEPKTLGSALDGICGDAGAFAILAALYHRARTGEGQYIDLAMSEVQLSMMPQAVLDYSMNRRRQGPRGNEDDIKAPHNCYPSQEKNRWIAIAVSTDEEWQAMCRVMDRPGLATDPRFADRYRRWQNREELDILIQGWTRQRSHQEAMEALQRAGVPAGATYNVAELASHPHLNERGAFVQIDSYLGRGMVHRLPGDVGERGSARYTAPPTLGQHNEYVFHDVLGMDDRDIQDLVEKKVIF